MGVYYRISYGWGLRIDEDGYPGHEDGLIEWAYENRPEEFDVHTGGDMMNSTDEAVLISPYGGTATLLHTGGFGDERFGVFGRVNDFSPTEEHMTVLRSLADAHGLPFDIGWYVVSSVG